MRHLYILEMNTLSVGYIVASIFSHSCGCLFILFMTSFAVPEFLSIIRSHWFIFVSFSLLCCCCITSVVSDSMWPHRRQPSRLPRPWDSPGKNTGVGCHFLLQCMKVKSESEDAQLCPTPSNPMDCSLPGSSIHGIFQARVLEWGAIAFFFILLYIFFITTFIIV